MSLQHGLRPMAERYCGINETPCFYLIVQWEGFRFIRFKKPRSRVERESSRQSSIINYHIKSVWRLGNVLWLSILHDSWTAFAWQSHASWTSRRPWQICATRCLAVEGYGSSFQECSWKASSAQVVSIRQVEGVVWSDEWNYCVVLWCFVHILYFMRNVHCNGFEYQ